MKKNWFEIKMRARVEGEKISEFTGLVEAENIKAAIQIANTFDAVKSRKLYISAIRKTRIDDVCMKGYSIRDCWKCNVEVWHRKNNTEMHKEEKVYLIEAYNSDKAIERLTQIWGSECSLFAIKQISLCNLLYLYGADHNYASEEIL